jgi:hypothetical protein
MYSRVAVAQLLLRRGAWASAVAKVRRRVI